MKDFNFFDPYKGGKKDFGKKYFYVVGLSISLVFFIAFTYAFNYFKISKLNSEIADIQQNLSLKENVVKLREIENEEKKLVVMNQYYGIVVNISDGINASSALDSKLISKINSCVPQGVFYKIMALNSTDMQLQAEGKDRETIASFERALRNLDVVKDVHIASINDLSKENKILTFSLNCNLKDVDNNEGN